MTDEAIILAAGLSSRAGTNKMLLEINNKTVLESCIDTFYESCSKIIVVGGYKIDSIRPIVDKYNRARLVYNEKYINGMFSSIKVGLKYIKADRFFLTPGDYPLLKKESIFNMQKYDADVIIPSYKGKCGHPVLIKSKFIDNIINGDYKSLRDFIRIKTALICDVDDVGILKDIDTIEDYNMIKGVYSDLYNNRSDKFR